jgi:hypothetical protein
MCLDDKDITETEVTEISVCVCARACACVCVRVCVCGVTFVGILVSVTAFTWKTYILLYGCKVGNVCLTGSPSSRRDKNNDCVKCLGERK